MLRGMTAFKCRDCGHTFKALDIEWRGTAQSMPQPCKHCGSMNTHPVGGLLNRLINIIH